MLEHITRDKRTMSSLNRLLRTAAVLLCCLGITLRVTAQGATEIWTDKQIYDLGETIELTLNVTNPSAETIVLSTTCNAPTFVFGDVALEYEACVAYTHHFVFPPGSERSWTWPMHPNELGLPELSGEHQLIARFAHLADTVWVQAPGYLGGRIIVEITAGANPDTVEAIRDDLQAVILSSHTGSEIWEIAGTSIQDAIAKYEGHGAILSMTPYRFITTVTSVATEPELRPYPLVVSSAYPNPFHSQTTIRVQVQTAQQVYVEIVDLLGRQVSVLYEGKVFPGVKYEVNFSGEDLPNGRYLYRVSGETFRETGLVVLAR